jgi:hypothetical protein
MKTSIKTLLFTFLIASASVSLPVSAYMAFGAGAASCGVWISKKAKGGAGFVELHAWVLGFVSANAWVKDKNYETDADGMADWVDNYCQANPLKDISDAAEALVLELEK